MSDNCAEMVMLHNILSNFLVNLRLRFRNFSEFYMQIVCMRYVSQMTSAKSRLPKNMSSTKQIPIPGPDLESQNENFRNLYYVSVLAIMT